MFRKIRQLITPQIKEKIMDSLFFRIYSRILLQKKNIRLSVEITTKCNANCAMCSRSDHVQHHNLVVADMDENIKNKILQQAKTFVDQGYQVTFAPMGLGEPLLDSNLFNFISDFKKISPKIKVVIVTNGIALNLSNSKKLVNLDVDEISISLNVNTSADYKKYVRGKSFLLVKNNIKRLIKYRNLKKKKNVSIFIQFLDYDENPRRFDRDIKRWSRLMKYGDKCYIHPIVNEGGFNETKLQNFKKHTVFPCYSPLNTLAIRLNGDIYPCDPSFYIGNQKIEELYLGNIGQTNYFTDIHQNKNSKIYKILDSMKKNDYCHLKNCQKCFNYNLAPNPFFKTFPWQKNKWW